MPIFSFSFANQIGGLLWFYYTASAFHLQGQRGKLRYTIFPADIGEIAKIIAENPPNQPVHCAK